VNALTHNQRHILFIASWYPNRKQPVLGNFIQRHAIAASLTNRVSVAAAFSHDGDEVVEETENGQVHEYISLFRKTEGKGIVASISKLRKYRKALQRAIESAVQRNGSPDIIHIHVAWPVALALNTITAQFDCPIVLTEHWSGYLPEDGNYKGMLLKHYTSSLFSKAKAVTVVSQRMQHAMEKHGLRSSFIQLPNAVDDSVFRFQSGKRPEQFHWLHVSMLVDREKNIRGLLRAFSQHCKQFNSKLTIIGDGPEKRELETYANDLGIAERVDFSGLKSAREIADIMCKHHALLMFSNFEGMPVTIIEAKYCGLPVIATDTGAIPEMLNAKYDRLVPVNDESRLVAAMSQIQTQHTSLTDGDFVTISEDAIQQYSYSAVNKKLDSIYNSALKKH
jgi:L-malate glycosyltransferase